MPHPRFITPSALCSLFALLAATFCASHLVKEAFDLHDMVVPASTLLLTGLGWKFGTGSGQTPGGWRLGVLMIVPACAWALYAYLIDVFGTASIGAFVFHAQMGREGQVDTEFVDEAHGFVAVLAVLLIALAYLGWRDARLARSAGTFAAVALLLNPFIWTHPVLGNPVQAFAHDGSAPSLGERYVPPRVTAPAKPRNMILIYAESVERTFADSRFGGAYDAFSALAARGAEFTAIRQIENTGWTIAGMVASQCGTPLMPFGMLKRNDFNKAVHFAPGLTCLGEILAADGYLNSYIGGADLDFAGKGNFLRQHGYSRLAGLDQLGSRVRPDDLNRWGINDDRIFEFALEEVRALQAQPRPFLFSVLTLSAHGPNGFPANACEDEMGPFDGRDILYGVRCTGRMVTRFVEALERENLIENTTVVVMSDHLAMRNSEWPALTSMPRANSFIVLNSGREAPAERRSRSASMVDVFPTLLELLGYTVHGNGAAGLGHSLLQPTPNLVETLGVSRLDSMIAAGDTDLRDRIWLRPAASREAGVGKRD